MSCLIQENVTCSSVFDGVDHWITMVQAVITAIITLVSISMNVTLLTAVIVYSKYMEVSFIYIISMITSNLLVNVFFGGGILLSSAMRDWPFGYLECQDFGFVALAGLLSRWVAMGAFSFDRATRIFLPFFYSRRSKYITKILVTVPWFLAMIHVQLLASLGGRVDFVDHFPTCLVNYHCDNRICFGIQIAWTLWCLFFGGLVPMIFLTLMFVKAKMMSRADLPRLMGRFEIPVMGTFGASPDFPREETAHSPADDSQATNPSQVGDSQANPAQSANSQVNRSQANCSRANRSRVNLSQAILSQANRSRANPSRANLSRANRYRAHRSRANRFRANCSQVDYLQVNCSQANNPQLLSAVERRVTITSFWMMANFSLSVTLLVAVLACNYSTIVSFSLTDLFQVYAITDFILVLRNKEVKKILRRLYRAFRPLFLRNKEGKKIRRRLYRAFRAQF